MQLLLLKIHLPAEPFGDFNPHHAQTAHDPTSCFLLELIWSPTQRVGAFYREDSSSARAAGGRPSCAWECWKKLSLCLEVGRELRRVAIVGCDAMSCCRPCSVSPRLRQDAPFAATCRFTSSTISMLHPSSAVRYNVHNKVRSPQRA